MYLGSPLRQRNASGKYQQEWQVYEWSKDQVKQGIHLAVSQHLEKQNYQWEGVWSMRVRQSKTSCRAMIHEAGLPKSPAWEAVQSLLDTGRKATWSTHWFSLFPHGLWCWQLQQQHKLEVYRALLPLFSSFPWDNVSSDSFGFKEPGAVQTLPSKGSFVIKL